MKILRRINGGIRKVKEYLELCEKAGDTTKFGQWVRRIPLPGFAKTTKPKRKGKRRSKYEVHQLQT